MLTYNPVRVLSPESIPDLSVVDHIITVSVHHSRGGPGKAVVSEPQIYLSRLSLSMRFTWTARLGSEARSGQGRGQGGWRV